jgi:endonuclease YncB( thermonuclease family)
MRPCLIAAVAVLSLTAPAHALTGPARVVDGDTLAIGGERIRLDGIDAPEKRQTCADASNHPYACGQVASNALSAKIAGAAVRCDGTERDRYDRLLAICWLGSEDLNAWLVSSGLAVAYRHFSTRYAPQEDAAHAARLGLWSGGFTMPWDWRRTHR